MSNSIRFYPIILFQDTKTNKEHFPSLTFRLSKKIATNNNITANKHTHRFLSLMLFPAEILDTIITVGRSAAYPTYYCCSKIHEKWDESGTLKKGFLIIGGIFLEIGALILTPICVAIQAIVMVGHVLKSILITPMGFVAPDSKTFAFCADLPDYLYKSTNLQTESRPKSTPPETSQNTSNSTSSQRATSSPKKVIQSFRDFNTTTQQAFLQWCDRLINGRDEEAINTEFSIEAHKGILPFFIEGNVEGLKLFLDSKKDKNIDFDTAPEFAFYGRQLKDSFYKKGFRKIEELLILAIKTHINTHISKILKNSSFSSEEFTDNCINSFKKLYEYVGIEFPTNLNSEQDKETVIRGLILNELVTTEFKKSQEVNVE